MKISNTFLLAVFLFVSGCTITNIDYPSFARHTSKKSSSLMYNLEERMAFYKVPGVSIAVAKDGKIVWAKGFGFSNVDTGELVTENTLFQAGSISKALAALAVLKLYEESKINLDENANSYLKSWRVEENEYTEQESITPRRLLSHTAGVNVHGFPGYNAKERLPSLVEVLNGDRDTEKIIVNMVPGETWRYSGGGYAILQKLVEDVTNKSFEEYMQISILNSMNMNDSSYQQPLRRDWKPKASVGHDSGGKVIEGKWHNYPENAAAGLWTTPSDLAKYCIEIQRIYAGATDGILSKNTIDLMLTPIKNEWGLGPRVRKEGEKTKFWHSGRNKGFVGYMASFADGGNSVVIMANGDNAWPLIREIRSEISKYYGL